MGRTERTDASGGREGRRTFRSSRWVIAFVGAAAVGSGVGGWLLLSAGGASMTGIALVGLGAFFGVALAEAATSRLVLESDRMVIVANFRRTTLPRTDLVRVVAEKGAPIMLERASGGWVEVPGALGGLHPNTLRAWIRDPRA